MMTFRAVWCGRQQGRQQAGSPKMIRDPTENGCVAPSFPKPPLLPCELLILSAMPGLPALDSISWQRQNGLAKDIRELACQFDRVASMVLAELDDHLPQAPR